MRTAALLLLFVVGGLAAACGGKGAAQCKRASTLDGTEPTSCRSGAALLVCPADQGGFCACVTDEQSCPACAARFHGVVCRNECAADEYAVECGASSVADAGPVVVFEDPPPNCHVVGLGAGTKTVYCCPCLPGATP